MSAQRNSIASSQPFDSLLSNSSDPVQSSIRRNSAMGWSKSSSPTTGTGTTPLRISKRDSSKPAAPLVARRSSSSYKHLSSNNLVSKSPFKSQIPTPPKPSSSFSNGIAFPGSTPRKVSGEKRPRPDSMHDQAENERLFALKRERRQSKVYQGLIEKEPVTKSPFKCTPPMEEEAPPVPPLKPIPIPPSPEPSPAIPAHPRRAIMPIRPSLVTKRLHGPRAADQPSLERRRRTRKTVEWDERCEVLEFEREEDEDESFDSDEDAYGTPEQPEESAIVFGSLPSELQTDNRALRRVSVSSAAALPSHLVDQVYEGAPSTPSQTIPANTSPPLGRSTHIERTREDHRPSELDEDVNMMPPSPSPAKKVLCSENANRDSLIPKFQLPLPHDQSSPKPVVTDISPTDPFSSPHTKHEPQSAELSFTSLDEEGPMDPANLSIGHSEVSLSNMDIEAEIAALEGRHVPYCEDSWEVSPPKDFLPADLTSSRSTPPPTPDLSSAGVSSDSSVAEHDIDLGSLRHSPGAPIAINLHRRSDSPLNVLSRIGSPAIRAESPILRKGSPLRECTSSPNLSIDGSAERAPRTRISREEIQMRLMQKRSADGTLVLDGTCGKGIDEPPQPVDFHQVVSQQTEPTTTPKVDGINSDAQADNQRENRMSIMTDVDISAELATIQTAEKRTLTSAAIAVGQRASLDPVQVECPRGSTEASTRPHLNDNSSPYADTSISRPMAPEKFLRRPQMANGSSLDASFDHPSSLGLGASLRDSMSSVQLSDMRSALDRLMDDVKGTASTSSSPTKPTRMRVESVTEGIQAGRFDNSFDVGDESMRTETDFDTSMSMSVDSPVVRPRAVPFQRAATDSVVYTAPTFSSPVCAEARPVSPRRAIREREELILEKRRAARRRDDDESMGYYTPPRATPQGRPSRRRSRSTGDAGATSKGDRLLNIGFSDDDGDPLADSISKELRKLDPATRKGKYRIREHEAIFASADAEQVSHLSLAGDVNGGKAWRAVRRPSDMNEYSKQIKEYRSEKPGKAHGKVFVRVISVRLKVPLPQQPTALTCTLNNGIHFVTTPETRLSRDTRIDQEFELIEHNKLEFTLTLKVRRDPHIAAQSQALAPPPVPRMQPMTSAPKSKGGMLSFFSSSPKKQPQPIRTPAPPHKLPDNLARYLKQDGTLARALISFKDVAARCDTRLFETSYPLIGQRLEASGSPTTMELGEIVLQLFRLPPLPGVTTSQLPQSLEECHRGLRHVAWHKVTYFEGTLTQNGGDCTTWRRRRLRVIGANLVAFNDVTKKATATINLKKAMAVEDNQDLRAGALNPGARSIDNYDGLYAVERSFRLIFPGNQEIFFFADTDDEKAKWLEVFRALVGHIPPNPLWAELMWQRQQELAKQPSSSTKLSSPGPSKGAR